jgi:hypothetical protein
MPPLATVAMTAGGSLDHHSVAGATSLDLQQPSPDVPCRSHDGAPGCCLGSVCPTFLSAIETLSSDFVGSMHTVIGRPTAAIRPNGRNGGSIFRPPILLV